MKTRSPFIKLNSPCWFGIGYCRRGPTISHGLIGHGWDLDPTFGTGGKVTTFVGNSNSAANAVAVQSDGKIVVAGVPLLTCYNSDGTLDTTFGTNGIVNISGFNQGKDVAIQPDGKILVSGNPNNW